VAYFDQLKTYREGAGLKMAQLARAIEPNPMTPDTISRIEKHGSSPKSTLVAIVHALNRLYYEGDKRPIDPEAVITETSKFK
jgi:DNA-binding XRE family transcriptional regulator